MPPDGISGEKYDGFSGVLTIGMGKNLSDQFPLLKRWLNEITNLFEKSNKGIYLRIVDFSEDNRVALTQSAQPADIILTQAGNFSGVSWQTIQNFDLMPAFSSGGEAVPIAAGGYLLGIFGDTPQSLGDLPAENIGFNDDLATAWIALCEQFSPESTEKRTISTPDIGLAAAETPIPTSAPATGTQFSSENLALGDTDALFSRFLAGEILALPLNQNQVAKIRTGQSDGKYADIRFLNAALYTDLVVYAAIPASSRSDSTERAAASEKFIAQLLSDDAQARLSKYNLFPTAMVESVYDGTTGMQTIESALRRSDCIVRGAYESPISVDFDAFLAGEISAREIMRSLRNFR